MKQPLISVNLWIMMIKILFQFLLVIILMNILIAMMTTTFTKISETADTQWKYRKSFYQVEFLHSKTILPTPLRIFYYIAIIRRLITSYWCGIPKEECERDMENQKNYKD